MTKSFSAVNAFVDELTALNNMRYFKGVYNEFLQENQFPKLISMDFTKLKYINDNFGHEAGDICLKSFGKIIREVFNDEICVRRSGDEFLILTGKPYEVIEELLKKVCTIIEEYFVLELIPFQYGFNSGIVDAEHSIKNTLKKGDVMMYNAKQNGLLYEEFDEAVYNKALESEHFIDDITSEIESGKILYYTRSICDLDKNPLEINDVYSRNSKRESIFEEGKDQLLQASYKLKALDYSNLKELILSHTVVEGQKLLINLHWQTLLSRDLDFEKFVISLANVSLNNPENYIICINVNGLNNDWESIIPKIETLKSIGYQIALGGYDISNNNPVINIWAKTNIDYIKIGDNYWKMAASSSKIAALMKATIPAFIETGTTPIYMKVENDNDLDFLKSINSSCTTIGNVNGQEKQLTLK